MFVYKGPEGIVQVGGVPGKGAPVRRLGRDVAIWRDGGGLSPTPSPTRSPSLPVSPPAAGARARAREPRLERRRRRTEARLSRQL